MTQRGAPTLPRLAPNALATVRDKCYNTAIMDLIHIVDAAEQFGIHRATLYRWVKDGRIKGYKRGLAGAMYLDRSELRRLSEYHPVKVGKKR